MAFYGSLSKAEEKFPPHFDLARNAATKAFRRMLLQDFNFVEAARNETGYYDRAYLDIRDFQTKNSFDNLILENPNGIVNPAAYASKQTVQKVASDSGSSTDDEAELVVLRGDTTRRVAREADVRIKRFLTKESSWPPLSIFARWILRSRPFEIFMIVVIILSSVLMCLEGELPETEEMRIVIAVCEPLDFFFLLMFIVEILLKWMDDFPGFWNDYWNWFDLIVTAASICAPIFDVAYPDSHEDESLETLVNTIKYIRIARIFRTLNVVTRIHKIKLIWGAITRTFTALAFITILMLVFFYIFAIVGIQLCDRFTKTHQNNLKYVNRFSQLPFAFLTLFQIFTIDHWFPILSELQEIMGTGIATFYILTWLLLGTFIFKNIFAGVMVNTFQNIRQELVDETNEITHKTRLANEFDSYDVHALEPKLVGSDAKRREWEETVLNQLDLIAACEGDLSPSLWPRDTLFQYFILLEALVNNLSEQDQLHYLLSKAGAAFT